MREDLFGVCPYVTAQKLLTGKWALLIMHYLSTKTMRFNQLQRALADITQSTLTKQLHMMVENGLVVRTSYNQIPPRVEYSLSELGENFKPVLDELQIWGNGYIEYLKAKQ